MPLAPAPALAPDARAHQLFLGRQGIFTREGDLHGYELLHRAGHELTYPVDRWARRAQDWATLKVLEATFASCGMRSVAADALVFVNFTRSFLVSALPIPPVPSRVVIEVLESVPADAAVLNGVARLRHEGFRIALDDFVGLDSQLVLLPFADYVKIDVRDLERHGHRLVALAQGHGASLVAERVETAEEWDECSALGFDLFQGNYLQAPRVLERPVVAGSSWPTVADLAAAHRPGPSEVPSLVPSPNVPSVRRLVPVGVLPPAPHA